MLPPSRSLRLLLGLVVAVYGLSNSSARAAGNEEDRLIREGVESRRKNNDTEALESFKKAYELGHSPRAVAQMGLAEIALGRWVEAAGHLEEALAHAADPWVAKHLSTLNESYGLVRKRVGELDVIGSPARATVAVEGVVVGNLPLAKPLRVRSGECRFVVSAPGYESIARTVDVAAGQLTRETVNLSKVAGPVQPTSETGPVAHPVAVESEQGQATPRKPETDSTSSTTTNSPPPSGAGSSNHLPTIGIVLGSVGLAAVAAGVVFSVKTRSAGQDAANNPTFDPGADTTGHRYQTLQYVAYGVGGALIAAGITTYLLGREHDNGQGQPQVAIVPSPEGGALLLSSRF